MGCGVRLNHLHHYLKRVSAATNLDNTTTYFCYIIYSTKAGIGPKGYYRCR